MTRLRNSEKYKKPASHSKPLSQPVIKRSFQNQHAGNLWLLTKKRETRSQLSRLISLLIPPMLLLSSLLVAGTLRDKQSEAGRPAGQQEPTSRFSWVL